MRSVAILVRLGVLATFAVGVASCGGDPKDPQTTCQIIMPQMMEYARIMVRGAPLAQGASVRFDEQASIDACKVRLAASSSECQSAMASFAACMKRNAGNGFDAVAAACDAKSEAADHACAYENILEDALMLGTAPDRLLGDVSSSSASRIETSQLHAAIENARF